MPARSDAAGRENRHRRHSVNYLRNQDHRRDIPGVASGLSALGRDDIDVRRDVTLGVSHRADHPYDLHALIVGPLGHHRGVSEGGREYRNLVVQKHFDFAIQKIGGHWL